MLGKVSADDILKYFPQKMLNLIYWEKLKKKKKKKKIKYCLLVFACTVMEVNIASIGLDKSGYQVNSFLISQQKHMLRVLIRSASLRRF